MNTHVVEKDAAGPVVLPEFAISGAKEPTTSKERFFLSIEKEGTMWNMNVKL